MKKFYFILMMLFVLVSCSTTNYISRRSIYDMDEISYVLANHYPQLHMYYMEGVLDIDYLKDIILQNGEHDYEVRYHFVRYYYRNYAERMDVLKSHYSELYQMYVNGIIEITSLYKYVDKNTGKIMHHVSYRNIYDYYYRYYPRVNGIYIYQYRPRYRPAPPMVKHNPPKQEHRPSINPNTQIRNRGSQGRRR